MQIGNSLTIVLDGKPVIDTPQRVCDHRWGDGPDEYNKASIVAECTWNGERWKLCGCDICKSPVLYIDGKEYWVFPTGRDAIGL